ncbi:MAG: hypothetical protein JWP20_2471 [Roseomonas sp.]|nr:hypothetical protein [Roseomonas sp.]
MSFFTGLTWYEEILLLALIYWQISVPACLLLAGAGYAGRRHWAGMLVMMLGGAGVLVFGLTALDTGI